MPHSNRRITLVASPATKPDLDWRMTASTTRLAFVGTLTALRFALEKVATDPELDVERVIADRTGNAEDFLDLLANVPKEFAGDVVFLRDDGGGFISATGRGGDRVLYSLGAHDVRFYLETHDLVTGRSAFRERATA